MPTKEILILNKTRVVHCKKEPYDVLIDRTTKWGNPFRIGVHGDREEVIKKYREWLEGKRQIVHSLAHSHYGESISPPTIMEIKTELRGKILGCWCKPPEGFKGRLLCHGQILAEICDARE